MLSNYKNFYIPLSTEEEETLRQAQTLAPNTLKRKIKKAALRHATSLINSKNSTDIIDTNTKQVVKEIKESYDANNSFIFRYCR